MNSLARALIVFLPLSRFPSFAATQFRAKEPAEVCFGLRQFLAKTVRADGSFANGIDPLYEEVE